MVKCVAAGHEHGVLRPHGLSGEAWDRTLRLPQLLQVLHLLFVDSEHGCHACQISTMLQRLQLTLLLTVDKPLGPSLDLVQ